MNTNNENNIKGNQNTTVAGYGNMVNATEIVENIKDSILKDVNVSIQNKINKQVCAHWYLWGIIIIILLAILGMQIPKMDFENNYVALIFGFVGILTTFIVIGNYSQVKYLESKFSIKIEELKTERKLFEIEKHEILSLLYLEMAKTYYNHRTNDTKAWIVFYKINILKAILYAEKASIYDEINNYLSGIRIASCGFTENDKIKINEISTKINYEKINSTGNFLAIRDFLFNN